MFSISKKVFGLAGVATVFAGMAFGQATCSQLATTGIIRAEGTTEQVAPIVITCTAGSGGSIAGTGSLQVFLSPALPVTSKVTSTTTGATEAVAIVSGDVTQYQATVSGSTLNFTGVALPVLAASGTYTITISNIRVNATSLTVGSGVPPSISATTFISGSAGSVIPAALGAAQVAFAQNGLAASVLKADSTSTSVLPVVGNLTSGSSSFVICRAYQPNLATAVAATVVPASRAFVVRVGENFASAFRYNGAATEGLGEQSQVFIGTKNPVTDGTRVSVAFSNVPAGVALYVPTIAVPSVNGAGAATLRLTASAAGTAFATVSSSTTAAVTGLTLAAVSLTSGAGSATFEVITEDLNSLDVYDIPVYVVTTANGASATTGIGVSVAFATVGSTKIPNFVVGANTSTLTGSKFNACSTSLLFPFVTNQLGFDTGIAISNTSSDPFGTAGATAQAGTCSLNFYGSGAPTPAAATTPNVPTGTTYTQVLSGVAAGFQGYVIAQCSFQYAHGFAFITNGVGTNGGLSQGYLAGVIPDVNQQSRATTTGEILGN